ncbi:MAG TPA: DUF397 domain-containing protein [Pseudonocardiaceae bacterium]|jgi:hypothetical protein|nr:DUF397 domain-containing protein [Pseudonocardiaceae bacterium]
MTSSNVWRKSSYSNGGTQNTCVELANNLAAVRDSKNPTGPTLRVNLGGLLVAIKAGQIS